MWDDVRLPDEAMEPDIVQVFEYWRSKVPAHGLPGRQHIDPVELPGRLLPSLLLLDVEREGGRLRFRIRLASTLFVNMIGREVTGLCFDELGPPERVGPACDALAAIVHTGRPVFMAGRLSMPSPDYYRVKRLCLPLASNGQDVDKIFIVFQLEPYSHLTGQQSEAPELSVCVL